MDQEIEVKYYLKDVETYRQKVRAQGGVLIQPRVREINLRFDTPDLALRRQGQVLRLRQDTSAYMTYKGMGAVMDGVLARTEIEIEVNDFAAASRLLQSLGYQVFFVYEKYRENYQFAGLTLSVDETPFGNFTELEGPSAEVVRNASDILALNWTARVNASYIDLFYALKARLNLPFRDLVFESFRGLAITNDELLVKYGDVS